MEKENLKCRDNQSHVVSKEEFFRLLGLDKNGKCPTGDYTESTKAGYPIKKKIKDAYGRVYIIGQKPGDYFVGAGYDESCGYWDQGYYGFSTIDNAVKFIEKNYLE